MPAYLEPMKLEVDESICHDRADAAAPRQQRNTLMVPRKLFVNGALTLHTTKILRTRNSE